MPASNRAILSRSFDGGQVSDFKAFSQAVTGRLASFSGELFTTDCGDIFAAYLAGFPAGTDPIFRERSEHNCNCCANFIRGIGRIVRVKDDGELETLWSDHADLPEPYRTVSQHLDRFVKSGRIVSVYRTEEDRYGKSSNVDNYDLSITWNHFFGKVPKGCVSQSAGQAANRPNTAAQVLRRGLDEIRLDDLDTVLDLIDNNNLYRGETVRNAVEGFRELKAGDTGKDTYHWQHCRSPYAMFRNTSIGTLLTDLANGTDLDSAVRSFEKKVAPENYKRSSAVITTGMVEQAMNKISELGLTDSLQRKYARIEDISISDVLFVDNKVRGKMKGGLKDLLMAEVKTKPVKASDPIKLSIEDFMEKSFSAVSLVLSADNLANMVALTAPAYPDAPSLFQWSNGFGWSYEGNVADSIKQRVKKAGGNVTNALLRCSLAWYNRDDLDIHARHSDGTRIYFGNKQGVLDVDMNAGSVISKEPVENLSWTKSNLKDGIYYISVNCFTRRDTDRQGCELEVEFAGKLLHFTYSASVKSYVPMLEIEVRKGQVVNVVEKAGVKSGSAEVEFWGVKSGRPVPVSTILKSPNHWTGETGKGALHWFFMLDGCKSPNPSRGMYNEFLRPDLIAHRKVFEVLGAKMLCEGDDQLAGVGFTHARQDKVIAIADNRTYEVSF